MGTIWQDIRYGLRMLLKSPSVSIVATIALVAGVLYLLTRKAAFSDLPSAIQQEEVVAA